MTATNDGDVVVAGTFRGTVDLGGVTLTSTAPHNLFIAVVDAQGTHAWNRVFPHTGLAPTLARSVTVDAADNIVIVGELATTLDFGGGPLTAPAPRVFMVKFGADGNHLWSKRYGIGLGCHAEDVAVDASGNIALTGAFVTSIDFGAVTFTTEGAYDGFVAKFGPNGSYMWSRQIGGVGAQFGRHIVLDENGDPSVGGTFTGSINLGSGSFTTDDQDVFLAHYGGDTFLDWWRVFEASEGHVANAMAIDADGDLILGGAFSGTIDFGTSVLTSTGGLDGYVIEIADGGVVQRSAQAGGPQAQSVSAIACDRHGGIIVAGTFSQSLRLGSEFAESGGTSDVFVASLNLPGTTAWLQAFGGAGSCDVRGLAADAAGNLLLTGSFSQAIELGSASLTGAGYYLAKLGGERPPDPDFAVTLFQRGTAIEVRWSIGDVHAFDTIAVLRAHESEAAASEVFNGSPAAGRFIDHSVAAGEKYRYQIVGVTSTGRTYRSTFATATVPVFTTQLAQNAPNPFNPTTSIAYSLSERVGVTLVIFDVSGAVVRRFEEGTRDAGEYTVAWDGRDDAGRAVASGVYFYRLDGVAGVAPRKMVLLK
jgi:hypothetical protein